MSTDDQITECLARARRSVELRAAAEELGRGYLRACILECLAAGATQQEVAGAIGVVRSRISQIARGAP